MAQKDAFYLKHDLTSADDPEIKKLIRAGGLEAYGLFWRIVEELYKEGGRLPDDTDQLAYDFRVDQAKVEAVVSSKLFYRRDDIIGSETVDRRLAARAAASEAGREFAARQLRKDGKPKGTPRVPQRVASTPPEPGEERRGEEITAAPSAADLDRVIQGALKPGERALLMSRMETATLPFAFGDRPKGSRLWDLSEMDARAILERSPRLGLELRRLLQFRIDEKKREGLGS